MTLDRRTFLAAGAAASLASAPALAQAREPLAVMTPFGFNTDFIEMMNAVAGGHLARQGFDARLLGANGTAPATQQLVAGQVQFIRSAAIDMIRAVQSSGAPLVAVATSHQGSTFHVVSLRDKPVREAKDLAGKTVGIVSVGGTTDIFLDLMLQSAGLKRDDVRREVTGASPGALQLVKAGRVDCFMTSISAIVALRRANEPIEIWSTDRYAPMPSQCYVTTRDTIERRPQTVVRFLRAMKASMDEMLAGNSRAVFERAGREYEIPGIRDLDFVVEVAQTSQRELWLSRGRENLLRNVPELWESGFRALKAAGLADPPDPSALWTNRFVEEALRG
ncbi:MAG: ABC transporter substrate-binding protein [Azospirillum sp.]|nr:ABC transporter substrate-binding protein [Azospirillum sp.]MCA3267577.1 ABC transporter substrate-binding protein [Azospirillum sp.]